MTKPNPNLVRRRRNAAEEVCWTVLLYIGLGELEGIPIEMRGLLGKEMQKWADLAVQTGQLAKDTDA